MKSFDSSSLVIGGAIGEAHFPEDGENAAELLVVADKQMYAHKETLKQERAARNG